MNTIPSSLQVSPSVKNFPQKPIQVVQPLQSKTANPKNCELSNQRVCVESHISVNSTMSTPISGSFTASQFLPASASFSHGNFSMLPSFTQQAGTLSYVQQNHHVNEVDRSKQGTATPTYIYQSLPMAHPIVLANQSAGGYIVSQNPNLCRLPSHYMVAQNQSMKNPQHMLSMPGGQVIRGPMQFGTMAVVLTPNGTANSNFFQLPDTRFSQSSASNAASCMTNVPTVPMISGNFVSQSAMLPMSQSNLSCGSPIPGVQQLIFSQPFAQVPPDMTLTRLSNGALALTPVSGSFPTIAHGSPAPQFIVQPHVQPPNALPRALTMLPNSQSSPGYSESTPSKTDTTRPTTEIMRQIDAQIMDLRCTPNLTEQQTTRLHHLLASREKVSSKTGIVNVSRYSGHSGPNAILPRPPNQNKELIGLLRQYNLYPMTQLTNTRDTVLVEFRLNKISYAIYLTRKEKDDLERLLATVLPVRKAEILRFIQQEQSNMIIRQNQIFSQTSQCTNQDFVSYRFASSSTLPQNINPPQASLSSSLSVLAAHPLSFIQSYSKAYQNTTSKPSHPFSLVSRPQTPAQALNLFQTCSSQIASGPETTMGMCKVISNPKISTQNESSTNLESQTKSLGIQPKPAALQQPTLTPQQSLCMSKLQSSFQADRSEAVAIPCSKATTFQDRLPTLEEMIKCLAPFHVLQDLDNTPQAIEKVEDILDKAFHQLNTRKRQTEDAVNSILFIQKWRKMQCDFSDRLVISRMALDLEEETFASEKISYDSFLKELDGEFPIGESLVPVSYERQERFLKFVNCSDFRPVTFDDAGNCKPFTLILESESIETSVDEVKLIPEADISSSKENDQEVFVKPYDSLENEIGVVSSASIEIDFLDKIDVSSYKPPLCNLKNNGELQSNLPNDTLIAKNRVKSPSNPPSLSDSQSESSSKKVENTDADLLAPPSLESAAASPSSEEEDLDDEDMNFGCRNFDTDIYGWPEWVQKEFEVGQVMDMSNVVEDNDDGSITETSDSLHSTLPGNLKSTWGCSTYSADDGFQDTSSKSSLANGLPDSRKSSELQHSEDPDIDAAIRSIIGY